MLFDKQNLISEDQTVISTCYSVNYVYFGPNDVSYLPFRIQVSVDFAGLTGLSIDIETSKTQNFSSYEVLATTTLPVDKLKAGAVFPISHVPKGNLGFLRLKYNVTGVGTAGRVYAGVVLSNDSSWQDIEVA